MNETDVKRRLLEDRERGFVALVRGSSHDLFVGLVRLVGDRQAAEDLSQETFVRAWRALTAYDDDRVRQLKLRGWLWTIAVNRARTHLGRRQPVVESAPVVRDVGDLVADADACEGLLRQLDETGRTAVVLRHVVGLPYTEIAGIVDKPTGTVKSDVHRALRRLREIGGSHDR